MVSPSSIWSISITFKPMLASSPTWMGDILLEMSQLFFNVARPGQAKWVGRVLLWLREHWRLTVRIVWGRLARWTVDSIPTPEPPILEQLVDYLLVGLHEHEASQAVLVLSWSEGGCLCSGVWQVWRSYIMYVYNNNRVERRTILQQ